MRRLYILIRATSLLTWLIPVQTLYAQNPGTWDIQPGNLAGTTTYNAVGIGTVQPSGLQEIMYCSDQFHGLIITRKDCGVYNLGPNDFIFPTYDFRLDTAINGEGSGTAVFIPPIDFTLTGYGSSAAKPLIWIRTENTAAFLSAASGRYTSRFIVTPYGRSGFNIENPRATLDIKSIGSYNMPAVIIGRQKLGTTNRTQHIHFVPLLNNDGYNRISLKDDQGIFFTDGLAADGCNANGAFIIAPWTSNDSAVSGIRMDASGNVGIGVSNTGGYRVAVNGSLLVRNELRISNTAISWPDYVFEDYAKGIGPMSLDKVEQFVLKHHHLPGMPSAAEVEKNGINTAETFGMLLQKIEELTLTVIAQQKQIDQLKAGRE